MPSLIAVGQMVRVHIRRSARKMGSLQPPFQSHSMSSELTQISRVPMTFYQSSIVAMALIRPILYHFQDIWPKFVNFLNPHLLNAPTDSIPMELRLKHQGAEKTRMMGLPGRENFDNFSMTCRQTDRHQPTDSTMSMHSVMQKKKTKLETYTYSADE